MDDGNSVYPCTCIGTVERLIMLILLSVDHYAAMGFVLTAKSIARYDKIAKDVKFAERW
ncbi:MAG: hypothetical protein NC307_09370 [Roseburia sp.]|nr:hypothetical protein [Roseburia sp.]